MMDAQGTQTQEPVPQKTVNSRYAQEESRSLLGEWLPSWAQMENAVRLRFDVPPDPSDEEPVIATDSVLYASMRQGMGMIIATALLAGLIPFLWNWIAAGRLGTTTALAELGRAAESLAQAEMVGIDPALIDGLQRIAGLEPAVFPGWMAAGLSAFGLWINMPLQWLAWWIVYGLAVLLLAKLLGATTTLQQFYTVTSFAVLPLILTALAPIPCLGVLVTIVALVWAVAVYTAGVRSATRLSLGMSMLCTVLPALTIFLLAIVVAVATAATAVGILL